MEFATSFLICAFALIAYKIYSFFTKYFNYFELQGIPYVKPVPVFGSFWGAWKERNYHLIEQERVRKYGKLYGLFHGRTPSIVVSDPALIKRIFIKDFDSFVNRIPFAFNNEYLERALGFLEDEQWKEMRSIATPSFTTGKIKKMINLMNEPATAMVNHLNKLPERTMFNMREKIAGFVLDVTASCGFGIKVDCINDPKNPFLVNAATSFLPDLAVTSTMIFTLANLYPRFAKRFVPASAFRGVDFFAHVARSILEERRKQSKDSPKRNDFVDIMMEASESHSILADEKSVIAQIIVFLVAGFDTTAFTLTMILHCLAMNQDAQDKVRAEILEAMKKQNGEINYEMIHELPYTDKCIAEAQRLFPAGSRLERECTKDVNWDEFKLKKGMSAIIPVHAIHMNPEYFPNPEKYDPERFSPEEKSTRDSMTFMPFGHGNRSCVGMRFALDNMKIGLCHILKNFKVVSVPETINPPKTDFIAQLGFYVNKECFLGIEKLKN